MDIIDKMCSVLHTVWCSSKRAISRVMQIWCAFELKLTSDYIHYFFKILLRNSVNCDCPGECSPEKDCLRWHWLTFWQPERKSSSESSWLWWVTRCYRTTGLVRRYDVTDKRPAAKYNLKWWRAVLNFGLLWRGSSLSVTQLSVIFLLAI